MMLGAAGVPLDLAQSRNYDAIFSQLKAAGVTVYYPTTQYQEVPQTLGLGFETDFLPPPFGTATPAVYQAMRDNGIQLAIPADLIYEPGRPLPPPQDDPLRAIIAAAGRDLIYGLNAYDEPVLNGVSLAVSQALYQHVKAIDPTLPVVQIQAGIDTVVGREAYLNQVKAHAQWADIVGFDVYPVGSSRGTVTPTSSGTVATPELAVKGYMDWLEAQLPTKQHAMVLQAFSVTDLFSASQLATLDPATVAAYKAPTAAQLRDMLSAAEGADAIFWWGQSHITSATASQLWQNVRAETLAFARQLLGSAIAGTAGADFLTGGWGDDLLDGGTGRDWLSGGEGDDVFVVDSSDDTVVEHFAAGQDSIVSTASFTLSSNVESLALQGSAAINGTGNGLSNLLFGNDAANTLNGGADADVMLGGAGNDIYLVDTSSDLVEELAGEGIDTVLSSASSFTLAVNIENGRILASGTASIAGNGENNVLFAGAGNNIISAGGGVDTASYAFASRAVVVSLAVTVAQATGGSGTDALLGFENLTGSNFNDSLTGNTGTNVLSGGTGADLLNGGLGNDLLLGGAGIDSFVFNTRLGISNIDTIRSFATVEDTIRLENTGVFSALAATGTLSAGAFVRGSGASQTDDRIIYNPVTGALLYDADGSGTIAAVKFATLTGVVGTLTAADFLVI